jgi:ATP-dependent DNA helicase RecG
MQKKKKAVNWAKILKSLEIDRLSQALLVAPSGCLDLRRPNDRWVDVPRDETVFLSGCVDTIECLDADGFPTRSPYPARAKVAWIDASGASYSMMIFGGAKPWTKIPPGARVQFLGRIVNFHGTLQAEFKAFVRESGFVQPQYAGVPGLVSGDDLRRLVRKALRDPAAVRECIEAIHAEPGARAALRDLGYADAGELLRYLHEPETPAQCERAIDGAKTLSLRVLKAASRQDFGPAAPAPGLIDAMRQAVREWPQAPSAAQRRALRHMARILGGSQATRTLLLGDVGAGKTRVFATPVAAFAREGRRCAVLAPNAPVAQQILGQIRGLWPDLSVGLCTASMRESDARVLVGTTALIAEIETLSERLALLVVDEQHKFSVDQRDLPVDHVIEATATPIPRSLALAEAGGWHLVTIDESAIRRDLRSHLLYRGDRPQVQRMAGDHIRAGRRVVYVYPVVEADANESVLRAHERLNAHFHAVGGALLLHGQMREADKLAAVQAFKDGISPVLICTTAVEVGLDVPGIGMLVVMHADRYGTSQLHQLRGRLARDGGDGDFVMYLGDRQPGAKALSRLQAVADCVDGLELARRDLDARGVGALLGNRQSGCARTLFLRSRVSLDDLRAS